jgi:phosphohistidine phosphatase
MNLFILRHAPATDRNSRGYATQDARRPLTDKGTKRSRQIAKALKAMDVSFDAIFSSTYLRARQTAEIVAEELGCKDKLSLTRDLTPPRQPKALIEQVAAMPAANDVLLVGHEPCLSQLIALLLTGNRDVRITLKKAGLCKLAIESLRYGKCAQLEWLLTPKQLLSIR